MAAQGSSTSTDREVTVYGFYGSFCTQKVYLTLAEKGVVATRRAVNIGPQMENYEPWYARLNPNMVIPTLVHGDEVVCDSSRIIRYIDAQFDGPALLPDEPEARAQVDEWIDRIDRLRIRELSYSKIEGALSHLRDRIVMPRRLSELRRHQRAAPELHEVYAARIGDVQGWIAAMKTPADLAAMKAELEGVLDDLEASLQDGDFVVGATYTLADMMATVLFARMRLMGLSNMERRPRLVAHYQRMRQRPNFPDEDIAERMDKARLFKAVAPFLLPRLALASGLLLALGCGLIWFIVG